MGELDSENDARTPVVTRLAPWIETAIGGVVPLAIFSVGAIIFADFVGGTISWQPVLFGAALILLAGVASAAFVFLQWQHMCRAAYYLSPTELQYWDWRGRRHVIALETIRRLRKVMLPVASIIIDYDKDGVQQTLAIRFTHLWDDRFGENLVKQLRRHTGHTGMPVVPQ